MLVGMWRKWNLGHGWWGYKMEQLLEDTLAVPQRLELPYDNEFYTKRNENLCSHKISHMNVHRSIIYNGQKIETT